MRLDERASSARHRIISAVLAVHPPVLRGDRLLAHSVGGWLLWGQLAAIVAMVVLGQVLRSQVARASAVSLGLMRRRRLLVHVSGGLTDMHIWFYALLALVALYQAWVPFLLAVGFRRRAPRAMSLVMPEIGLLDPEAQHNPLLFALLHAVFLLAEATFLAYGWKFTEDADRARRVERRRAEEQAVAQAEAQAELAAERAQAAEGAAAALAEREERTAMLEHRIAELVDAGQRLDEQRRDGDLGHGRSARGDRRDRRGGQPRDDHREPGQCRIPRER